MASLQANFEADWLAYLRLWLTEIWGPQVAAIQDRNLASYYFDTQRRLVAIRPRILRVADDFLCPQVAQTGWQSLQDRARRGDNLNPHLSLGHMKINNRDGLLNDWGVHHFHLGLKPHPRHPTTHIERGDLVVLALVDDDKFYAINVYQHGQWENEAIVESLHRNWPELIRRYRMSSISGNRLTRVQRRAVRSKNVNVTIAVSDGPVYGCLGGAVSAAGTSVESVARAIYESDLVRRCQLGLAEKLEQVLPALRERGYAEEDEVTAEFKVGETGYQANFPKYGVVVNLSE